MYKKNVWDQTKNPGHKTGDKETNIQFIMVDKNAQQQMIDHPI